MKKPMIAALAAVALSALTLTAIPTAAQAAPGQGHHGEGMKKLAAALGLTDDQKAQMKTIRESAQQQAKAIKADTTLTPDAKKAKLKELRKSTMEQLKVILTPDQLAKLKALRQQQKANKA